MMENGAGMKKLPVAALAALLVAAPVWSQQVEYYHLDALGSVRAITDENGEIITRHDYDPFGEEWNPPSSSDPRRFTGKERDSETGQDYFGARYYGASIGRFTGVDPVYTWQENLVDPQRWNRYAYVRNNPHRYQDPDGEVLVPVAIALAGAFLFNNLTNANVTEGPTHDTIVPNSVIVTAGYGLAAGGIRTAGREVFEEFVENATGLPVGGLPDKSLTRRPSGFRKETVESDWKDAVEGPTGGRLCPSCIKEVKVAPGKGPRDWDIDHQPPWSKRVPEMEKRPDLTRKGVLDEYNRGTRLACPSCNRSRGAREP